MSVVIFLLIVFGGGGASVWMMMNKSRKRPVRLAHEADNVTFSAADDALPGGPMFETPEFAAPRKPTATKRPSPVKKPSKPKGV